MSPNIIGQIILRRFRVDAFVASGGMGAVYRVWDMERNVPLAMKVLHGELAEDPAVFRRFQREANALKKLAHPNIVPFYGFFQTDEFNFLLERFIDGPSLQSILKKRRGPLPIEQALIYLKATSAALGYAHANGVVHCDVKPGNVMVDQGGNVYLTDFGIARHAESTTTTMGTAGTPAYMAPEQIRGEVVSPATDVYALGVVLFEMLTGQRPFRGTEAGTEKGGATVNERIRYGQLNLAPPDPLRFNPDLPVGLRTVILKALSKQPEVRYASTQTLFIAACAAAGISPAMVPERIDVKHLPEKPDYSGGGEVIPEPEEPPGEGDVPDGKKPVPPRTGMVLAITCIMLALVGGGIYAWTHPKTTPIPTVSPNQPGVETSPVAEVVELSIPPDQNDTPYPTNTPYPTYTPYPSETQPPTQLPVPDESVSPLDQMIQLKVEKGNFSMGDSANHAQSECERVSTLCVPNVNISFTDEALMHIVYLDAFWIDKTEVTNAMYALCVRDGKCAFTGAGGNDYPVVNVSWDDASKYCAWAGRRLPTEAEWEKAARGTDGLTFPWGDSAPSCTQANYSGCAGNTVSVDANQNGASPYGALNMVGNVWEWVEDWFDKNYYSYSPKSNPQGPDPQTYRSMRGGSFSNPEGFMRTTGRGYYNPSKRLSAIGFRCSEDP